MRKVKPTDPLMIDVYPIGKHQFRRLAEPRRGPRTDNMDICQGRSSHWSPLPFPVSSHIAGKIMSCFGEEM